jgi:NACHT domain-containing protein
MTVEQSTVINILAEFAEKNGGKMLGVASDKATKLKDAITIHFADYFTNSITKCSQVTTLFDRSKPVDLLTLYVNINLEYARLKISDKRLLEDIRTLSVGNAIRIFLIVGSAGTGKTFLLRWLFLTLLKTAGPRIPIYIELRGLNDRLNAELVPFIFQTLVARRAHLTSDSFMSGMNDGEYIFILDGLDEVDPDRRHLLSRQIVQLQDTYPALILVVSSRPDEGLASWVMTRLYSVLPLDKKGCLALVRKLPYNKNVKEKFLNEVESTLFERHISFLSNPLLITVMLLTYGDSADVPKKMHLFYEQAYATLFYRHDSWKEVGFQRKHFCPLLIDEFSNVLSAFCIASYKRLRFEFTISSALELIKKAARFERLEKLDASAFLRDLTESVCILQLDGVNYRFTHRSFQEYFAAVFITRAPSIELSNLLDTLVSRRGDLVIPMAMEMNPSLIEREWILPRLKMIKPASPIDTISALKFATETFGPLVFNIGSLLQREQISLSSSHSTSTRPHDFLHALEHLYPGCLDAHTGIPHTGILDCTFDDLKSVERFGIRLFEKWWTSNQSLRLQLIQDLKDLEHIQSIQKAIKLSEISLEGRREASKMDLEKEYEEKAIPEQSRLRERKTQFYLRYQSLLSQKAQIEATNNAKDLSVNKQIALIEENLSKQASVIAELEKREAALLEKFADRRRKIEEQEAAERIEIARRREALSVEIKLLEAEKGQSYQSAIRRLESYSAKSRDYSDSSEMVSPTSDFAQMYFSALSELMQNHHQIGALDTLAYDRVCTKLAEKIRNAISRSPKIDPDVYVYVEWFSSTTIAQKVVKLADQLASLYDTINSRFEDSKKIGSELLD